LLTKENDQCPGSKPLADQVQDQMVPSSFSVVMSDPLYETKLATEPRVSEAPVPIIVSKVTASASPISSIVMGSVTTYEELAVSVWGGIRGRRIVLNFSVRSGVTPSRLALFVDKVSNYRKSAWLEARPTAQNRSNLI
jgi:hypothetical protein